MFHNKNLMLAKTQSNLFGSVGSSGHAQHLSFAAGGNGVLTTHSVAPVVTNTTVNSDLLHPLNITADSGNQHVDDALAGLAGDEISLSIYEPIRNLELLGVVDNSDQLLNLFVGHRASATIDINFSLLADQVGKALANTNNLGHGEHAFPLSIDVGVQHTQNVLELR